MEVGFTLDVASLQPQAPIPPRLSTEDGRIISVNPVVKSFRVESCSSYPTVLIKFLLINTVDGHQYVVNIETVLHFR